MTIIVHNEPNHTQSKFITHQTPLDLLREKQAEAADVSDIPQLSYLRVELVRLRAGMSDFIIRLATPKVVNQVKSNTLVTLRANKTHGTIKGVGEISDVISTEMQKREDSTHKWDKADLTHLTKLLFPYLKFFVANTALETMQFTTEALI
jgi:hypothetical protein